jgi:cation:H+ antiporter
LPDGILLALGLVLLLGGGEAVVRGAASLARSIGSNMANVGLVVGICGLLRPLKIDSVVVSREIPMMLLATVVVIVMACDTILDGERPRFDRSDAIIMFLFFCVFLYYTVGELIRQRPDHPTLEDLVASELPGVGPRVTFVRDSLVTLSGFGALLYGASLTVDAAVGLARSFGVPEVVIGISLVAIGTSLPELATGIMATLRGHMEIAIGNVIGSNIFNLLFVLAVTVSIRPLDVPPLGLLDLGVAGVLSLALLAVSLTAGRKILRAEAAVLIAIYLLYAGWRSVVT